MYRKVIFFVMLIFVLTMLPVLGKETLLMNGEEIKLIDGKDRAISLVTFLDNGTLVLLSETTKGKNLRVLLVDPFEKKKIKSIELPIPRGRYIACDPSGDKAILYGEDDDFWTINLKTGAYKPLFKNRKGKRGFSLFGGNRSRISYYYDNKFISWGYFLDEKSRLTKDAVVIIDPTKKGMNIFKEIVTYDSLKTIGKKYYPNAEVIQYIQMNKEYLTFAAVDNKKTGCIVAYNLKNKTFFLLTKLNTINTLSLARGKDSLAFISLKREIPKTKGYHHPYYAPKPIIKGVLQLYNFKTKKISALAEGKLLNPVFNHSATNISVINLVLGKNNKISSSLLVIPVADKDSLKTFALDSIYLDWRFIKNDTEIMLFNLKGVYAVKIK